MPAASTPLAAPKVALAVALTASLIAFSLWIGYAPIQVPLLAIAAAILFGATFLHAQAGLVILILSMLLSPEISLGGAGGNGLEGSRSVVLRTEDLILLLVGVAWMARMAIHKDLGAIRRTSLNACIFAYGSACLFSTLVGIEAARVRPLVGL